MFGADESTGAAGKQDTNGGLDDRGHAGGVQRVPRAATGNFDELRFQVRRVGVEGMRCAEFGGRLQPGAIAVHRHDRRCTGDVGRHHRRQAHTSRAEHHHAVTAVNAQGDQNRPGPGQHAAPERTEQLQRNRRIHLDNVAGRGDHMAGK
ncbi:hypothetical protein MPRM_06600 [Mycobacterium parmense]|uniref:Uncharacterized protein n=1 Tax=Mycobacterium parmense TaxID=185642 RepID=A0A7I7YNW0_9MYCO|nr:hypothetical protein MPRM_06600 [Mycobacterium parmense]